MKMLVKQKNYIIRQFAGIIGFIFTSAYLAVSYFDDYKNKSVCGANSQHTFLKIKLASQLFKV